MVSGGVEEGYQPMDLISGFLADSPYGAADFLGGNASKVRGGKRVAAALLDVGSARTINSELVSKLDIQKGST